MVSRLQEAPVIPPRYDESNRPMRSPIPEGVTRKCPYGDRGLAGAVGRASLPPRMALHLSPRLQRSRSWAKRFKDALEIGIKRTDPGAGRARVLDLRTPLDAPSLA